MIIKQKRVKNISIIKGVNPGDIIRVAVSDLDGQENILFKLGFSNNLELGEQILPNIIGPVTRKNAEGYYIPDKNRKKEKHTRMIEWTYKQWAGRGQTREVTDSTSIEYERYARTTVPPFAIEFILAEKEGSMIIASPEYKFNNQNEKYILMAMNVLLEAFGKCEIIDENYKSVIVPKAIRLNWEVLPKGKYPWETQKRRLEPFFEKAKGTNRHVIEKRLEEINKHNPDFTAIGTGGFGGYIVHGFQNKDLYVLECIQVNNATYILKDNWENISKLSKSEILDNKLHEARVIHNKQWYSSIAEYLA